MRLGVRWQKCMGEALQSLVDSCSNCGLNLIPWRKATRFPKLAQTLARYYFSFFYCVERRKVLNSFDKIYREGASRLLTG